MKKGEQNDKRVETEKTSHHRRRRQRNKVTQIHLRKINLRNFFVTKELFEDPSKCK
jgi:hypothetical protein